MIGGLDDHTGHGAGTDVTAKPCLEILEFLEFCQSKRPTSRDVGESNL